MQYFKLASWIWILLEGFIMTGEKNRFTTHEKMWNLNDGQLTTPKHDEMVLELLDPTYIKKLLNKYAVGGFNPSFLNKDEFERVVKIESEVPIVSGHNRFIIGYWDIVVTIEGLFLLPEGVWTYKESGDIQATHVDKHPKFRIFFEVKPTVRSFGETLRQLNTYREYVGTNEKYTHVCLYTYDTTFKRAFESQGIAVLTPLDEEVKYTEIENDANGSEEVACVEPLNSTEAYSKGCALDSLSEKENTIQVNNKSVSLCNLGRCEEAVQNFDKAIEIG